jgi:hypothetical protein
MVKVTNKEEAGNNKNKYNNCSSKREVYNGIKWYKDKVNSCRRK